MSKTIITDKETVVTEFKSINLPDCGLRNVVVDFLTLRKKAAFKHPVVSISLKVI